MSEFILFKHPDRRIQGRMAAHFCSLEHPKSADTAGIRAEMIAKIVPFLRIHPQISGRMAAKYLPKSVIYVHPNQQVLGKFGKFVIEFSINISA